MSRTYRRLKGDMTDRYWITKEQEWTGKGFRDLPISETPTPEMIRKLVEYHSDNGRVMSTPSWYINQFMTRTQRTETRRCLQKVLRLRDPEDAPLFPLAKKPHLWYW